VRLLGFCALAVSLLAARSAGCRTRQGTSAKPAPVVTPAHKHGEWITPLLTAPPARPTPTLWPGVTRVPTIPE
jgi:hypothetical protein